MTREKHYPLVEMLAPELQGMNSVQMGRFRRLLAARLPEFIQLLAQEAREPAVKSKKAEEKPYDNDDRY